MHERWRAFTHDKIVARDKVSLYLFWLRDESLEDSANLPALTKIEDILGDLEQRAPANGGTRREASA